jgi:hypothetical protein
VATSGEEPVEKEPAEEGLHETGLRAAGETAVAGCELCEESNN